MYASFPNPRAIPARVQAIARAYSLALTPQQDEGNVARNAHCFSSSPAIHLLQPGNTSVAFAEPHAPALRTTPALWTGHCSWTRAILR
jgi:hypothetical protein